MSLSLVTNPGLPGPARAESSQARDSIASLIGRKDMHPALLVSVRNAEEARRALDGGCEILDVKEPARGALGMADATAISGVLDVRHELAPAIPLSVALGEVIDWEDAGVNAGPSANRLSVDRAAGIQVLKLGTARLGEVGDWRQRFRQARSRWDSQMISQRSAPVPQWVAVAYADWKLAGSPPPSAILSGAADCGCSGLLIDTFVKSSGGLFHWLSIDELKTMAVAARQRGLWFALAGGLAPDDLSRLYSIAPDVVGIRTAACHGRERNGAIDPAAVRAFRCRLEAGCQTS